MGLNVMINAPEVARSADGVPLDTFGASAAAAFSFVFAAWGLSQLVLGLASLVVLLRYRSLVPLAFLALLLEQVSRMLLRVQWPIERIAAPGNAINIGLLAIMVLGFYCRSGSLSGRKPNNSRPAAVKPAPPVFLAHVPSVLSRPKRFHWYSHGCIAAVHAPMRFVQVRGGYAAPNPITGAICMRKPPR